jgi:integrase
MRVSEALALECTDLTRDGLLVRSTKYRKSRLLPVHDTVVAALRQYIARRHAFGTCRVFVGSDGQKLQYSMVRWTFAKLAREVGLGHSPRPRIHCLRHTFAVRALEACPQGAHAVARHQVALLTYLGHTNIAGTYWYLQSTPHLLRDIAAACESQATGGTPCTPR